jgi:uncharacterized protein YutE (UPF0331/DUF86 family)
MTLNPDVVRARCADIEDAVARLERFGSMPVEEFRSNRDLTDAACYRLLVAIEAALGLCYHVSARHFRKVPEQFAECFRTLGEAGVVPADLAERLQAMARFRNILVHLYAKVDTARVHEIICIHLDDLRAFASAIARLL